MENCLIIAGEKSGEEHCLSFFRELKTLSPQTSFWGVGGGLLEAEGLELIYHLNDFSTWGISGVFHKLGFYYKAMKKIKNLVATKKCKTAILIDFQTFNLILAWYLKKKQVKVLYYVAPQAWAWKKWRVGLLKKTVHTLFTIIPFEKKWFEARGVKRVKSITHPLGSAYKEELASFLFRPPEDIFEGFKKEIHLLILPGSRNFEVEQLLPDFIAAALILKQSYTVKIHVVQSSSVDKTLFLKYLEAIDYSYCDLELTRAFAKTDLCLAASGTVTLATALFNIPTVICYKSSLFNEYIFNTFISYSGPIGLGNIIQQKYICPELIQDQVTTFNILKYLKGWITNREKFVTTKEQLSATKNLILGDECDVPAYMANILNNAGK